MKLTLMDLKVGRRLCQQGSLHRTGLPTSWQRSAEKLVRLGYATFTWDSDTERCPPLKVYRPLHRLWPVVGFLEVTGPRLISPMKEN